MRAPETLAAALASEEEIAGRVNALKALAAKPLYLYGAGYYARELADFLLQFGVEAEACYVDPPYFEQAQWPGMEIRNADTLASDNTPYQLLIARCGNVDDTLRQLRAVYGVTADRILVIDCRFSQRFASMNRKAVMDRLPEYEEVYHWLGDEISRLTWAAYINAKWLYDSTPLRALRTELQYFPSDLPLFRPDVNDVFLDAGAFTGDTLEDVLSLTSNQGVALYVAFEPDPNNRRQLSLFVEKHGLDFVEIRPTGVWSEPATVSFSSRNDSRSGVSGSGDIEIEVEPIDRLDLKASWLKMDIEGAELAALQGAARTIEQHHPKLSITVYHKPEDMLEIPRLVKKLHPGYSLYLRTHSFFSEELVLYGI